MRGVKDSVEITFKRLTREDIDSLHDFLKATEDVTHVHSRIRTIDAAYDPSAHPVHTVIVGLSIGLANAVGHKALDIAADLVRDWLKKRQTDDAAAEVTLLWGPDKKPIVKVKKREFQ
jgi:hypothetical protein